MCPWWGAGNSQRMHLGHKASNSYHIYQDKKSDVNLALQRGERWNVSTITDDCFHLCEEVIPTSWQEQAGARWVGAGKEETQGKGRDEGSQHRKGRSDASYRNLPPPTLCPHAARARSYFWTSSSRDISRCRQAFQQATEGWGHYSSRLQLYSLSLMPPKCNTYLQLSLDPASFTAAGSTSAKQILKDKWMCQEWFSANVKMR